MSKIIFEAMSNYNIVIAAEFNRIIHKSNSYLKAYRKVSKIAHYYKSATQDLIAINQQLSDRIVELAENDLQAENKALKAELAKYKAILKDLKGTVNFMCNQ